MNVYEVGAHGVSQTVWPETHYVADFELLILMPPLPKCWEFSNFQQYFLEEAIMVKFLYFLILKKICLNSAFKLEWTQEVGLKLFLQKLKVIIVSFLLPGSSHENQIVIWILLLYIYLVLVPAFRISWGFSLFSWPWEIKHNLQSHTVSHRPRHYTDFP